MLYIAKMSVILVISCSFIMVNTVFALRCGNDLVSEGDRKFEVLNKCGEPFSKEVVGYTITNDKKRELKIEEWVYGPKDGYYNLLIFIGGILKEIKSIRK